MLPKPVDQHPEESPTPSGTPEESRPARRPWSEPTLTVAPIVEETASVGGSGGDGVGRSS